MHSAHTFQQLRVVRSGGFAGAEESVVLYADGSLTVTPWMREPRTMHLPAAGVRRLVETVMDAVTATDATAPGDAPPHPDRYQYEGLVECDERSYPLRVHGAPAASMQPLIAMLDRLIDTTP